MDKQDDLQLTSHLLTDVVPSLDPLDDVVYPSHVSVFLHSSHEVMSVPSDEEGSLRIASLTMTSPAHVHRQSGFSASADASVSVLWTDAGKQVRLKGFHYHLVLMGFGRASGVEIFGLEL